jgi:leader peptidase (prepilin peptidase)/N-methyltransferase
MDPRAHLINLIFSGLFGACIGSFLNVVIWRLPRDMSLVSPGSHCPSCNTPIRWFDNIPLISYVLLNGKCRACRTGISLRYPMVEFITGLLFVLFYAIDIMGLWNPGVQGDVVALLVHWGFAAAIMAVTFVDFDLRIIPDELSLGGAIAALAVSCVFPGKFMPLLSFAEDWKGLNAVIGGGLSSLAGGLAGALLTWGVGWLGEKAFRKEAMGFGDVKLMLFFGCLLGWKAAILIFFIAPFFGLLVAVPHKLIKKDSYIAYGPFLSMAAMAWVLFRPFFEERIAMLFAPFGGLN